VATALDVIDTFERVAVEFARLEAEGKLVPLENLTLTLSSPWASAPKAHIRAPAIAMPSATPSARSGA
jgi:hypothetical protein